MATLASLHSEMPWLAHSPDLSPCVYCLWGYLKVQVFKHRPLKTDELRDFICHEIAAIPEAITSQLLQNFRIRYQEWMQDNMFF